jgi:RNA polymerase-binding transcription factor DksA
MTDQFDHASEREQSDRDRALAAARAAAAAIPKGEPGECQDCGEYFARLVGGRCGFCRDGGRRR